MLVARIVAVIGCAGEQSGSCRYYRYHDPAHSGAKPVWKVAAAPTLFIRWWCGHDTALKVRRVHAHISNFPLTQLLMDYYMYTCEIWGQSRMNSQQTNSELTTAVCHLEEWMIYMPNRYISLFQWLYYVKRKYALISLIMLWIQRMWCVTYLSLYAAYRRGVVVCAMRLRQERLAR